MRIEWELKDFLVPQEKLRIILKHFVWAQKYEMNFRLYFSDKNRVWLFCFKDVPLPVRLLARYTAGEWNVEIPLI